jgi:hypothetical protein
MNDELIGCVESNKTEIDVTVNSGIIIEANVILGHTHNNKSILDSIISIEELKDKSFVYSQLSASSTWNIIHNLDKYPSVMIVDSANTVVIGNIEYISNNELELTFLSEFSGKAYLN